MVLLMALCADANRYHDGCPGQGPSEAVRADSLVSLLFGGQHIAVFVLTLLYRPITGQGRSRTDLLLAWVCTLLPLTMRATMVPVTSMGLVLVVLGSLLTTAAILFTEPKLRH